MTQLYYLILETPDAEGLTLVIEAAGEIDALWQAHDEALRIGNMTDEDIFDDDGEVWFDGPHLIERTTGTPGIRLFEQT